MITYLVFFILAFYLSTAVHVGGSALAARQFGIEILRVSVGFGPRLFGFGRFQVAAIPSGGYVKMGDSRSGETTVEPARTFDGKTRLVRAAVILAGPAALIAAAVALRGVDGWNSFVNGFGQILFIVFSMPDDGAPLARQFLDLLDRREILLATGILFAKIAAVNLLPVPILNGGDALLELLQPAGKPGFSEKLRVVLSNIGLCFLLLIVVKVAWAFYLALR